MIEAAGGRVGRKKATKKKVTRKKVTRKTATPKAATPADVTRWLERAGSKKGIADLDRYGITAHRPFGVGVGELRKYAKEIGTSHSLAQELWALGRYEARLLACFVDEPERVTNRQMNAWADDFDNWAIVDTACFSLFDQTPTRWSRVGVWAKARPEFKKRAAFALIWSLSVHDKEADDAAFLDALEWIERGAADDRHWVKKAVNMALRAVGKRNRALNRAAIELAAELAASDEAAPRWIGSHARRELESAAVQKKLR